eukprot:TRINITY_DN7604_c0_g1_i1.p2 TRINITY_DN7604_c0_g1~~TRINITY_DN7604_c0_g1_i1.p2  ORF type:complete len:224 (-),score=101.39 TRINITY_DN7604_c0_g1_i1:1097-1768(-)
METKKDWRKKEIAIVGGGPGGLTLAIALKREGFQNLVVYEREGSIESRKQGYSMTLSEEGGWKWIKKLKLENELEDISTTPLFHAFDGNSGRLLLKMNKPSGRRILRSKLRSRLVEICQQEGIEINWNHPIHGFDESNNELRLIMDNEKRGNPIDLLIAADGIHSKIRIQLFGMENPIERYAGPSAKIKRTLQTEHLFSNPYIKDCVGLHSNRGLDLMNQTTN